MRSEELIAQVVAKVTQLPLITQLMLTGCLRDQACSGFDGPNDIGRMSGIVVEDAALRERQWIISRDADEQLSNGWTSIPRAIDGSGA